MDAPPVSAESRLTENKSQTKGGTEITDKDGTETYGDQAAYGPLDIAVDSPVMPTEAQKSHNNRSGSC